MHDSTITPQLELAGTYYNENIFTRVIKYRKCMGKLARLSVATI